MKKSSSPLFPPQLTSILLGIIGFVGTTHADLPTFQEVPLLGTHAYFNGKEARIQVLSDGNIEFYPYFKSGEPDAYTKLPIVLGARETLHDGKVRFRKILRESLETELEPAVKFKEVQFTGKLEGGGEIEVSLVNKRGELTIEGQVTPPADSPNSFQFAANARILNFRGPEKENVKEDPEAVAKLVVGGETALKLLTGKKRTFDLFEPVEAASEEVSGAGCQEVTVELGAISNMFTFSASSNSILTLRNEYNTPLHFGFDVLWTAPLESKGKAPQLTIESENS